MPAYSIDGLTRFTQVGKTHPEQWFVFIDNIMNGDAVNPGLEFFIIHHYSRISNIRLTSQTEGTESHTDRSYRELLSFIIIDNDGQTSHHMHRRTHNTASRSHNPQRGQSKPKGRGSSGGNEPRIGLSDRPLPPRVPMASRHSSS